MQPLVSVIMPSFNETPHIIRESINSIINQSYKNWELLILDDSTDIRTREEIDSYLGDSRIKIIREEKRMGFVNALNIGISKARGKYIARIDADDIALPNRLETQVDVLERCPEIDVLGSAINLMDENGEVHGYRFYPAQGFKLNLFAVFRSPLAHPSVMFRAEVCKKSECYDPAFKMAEDLEFWLRLRKKGFHLTNLKEPLVNYRVISQMGNKRNRKQFRYNLRARIKNLSAKYFLLDILSLIIVSIYCVMPSKIATFYYAKENNNSNTDLNKKNFTTFD